MQSKIKIFFLVAITCLGIAVISCKEDDDSSVFTNDTSDTTAPTVMSCSPADSSTDVSINTRISVEFSEEMDTTSITTNSADTNCSGTIQLSSSDFVNCIQMSNPVVDGDGKVFSATSDSDLQEGATYKLKVTTGTKDLAGNTLLEEHVFGTGFTTRVETTADSSSDTSTDATTDSTPDTNPPVSPFITINNGLISTSSNESV
jgi:hypothetical protein